MKKNDAGQAGGASAMQHRFNRAAAARPAAWQKRALWQRVAIKVFNIKKGLLLLGSAEDKAWLREVMAAAQASPVAQQALAWAAAHEVTITVYRNGPGTGQYRGYGDVRLRRDAGVEISRAVSSLVHEIRHAWQEHHDLLLRDCALMLADRLTVNALYEADATAHGELARRQCEGIAGDPVTAMAGAFFFWFGAVADRYHRSEVERHRETTGAPAMQWQPYLQKLGRGFAGDNYLSQTRNLQDFITLAVLPRGAALRQFIAVEKQPSAAVKVDKRERFARVRAARQARAGQARMRR